MKSDGKSTAGSTQRLQMPEAIRTYGKLPISIAESLSGPGFRLRCFFFSILRWCGGFERMEKAIRDSGNFIDG